MSLSLPIDPFLPELVRETKERGGLVLVARPGSGKTTRFPPALARAVEGRVLVLEPRRLAARLAAQRVASEAGSKVGGFAGFQVRFERKLSAATRVLFQTEGTLTRRLLSDPELEGVAAVVLDEFHERHLQGDLALALLDRLRRRRPDLLLVVMSATLDAGPLADFLDAPLRELPGQLFALTTEFVPFVPRKPLAERVADGLGALRDGPGHVLAFLPGAAEIRRAERVCRLRYPDLRIVPLFGSLPRAAQDAAVAPSERPSCILATNIAESSLTIPGVRAVLDSGLARVARHAPGTGLPTLDTAPISQASAAQRAGRAAREGPGRCLRLYTRQDFERRPAFARPDILRLDLAETLLAVRLAGVGPEEALRWLTPPPAERWQAAARLLEALGACDDGRLTARGRALGAWPLHPRLGCVLLAAEERGVQSAAALAVALLAEGGRPPEAGPEALRCDLFPWLERAPDDPAARRALRVARRLGWDGARPGRDEALCEALLAGFGDRVAQRAGEGLKLCGGGSLQISPRSRVRDPFCIVLESRRAGREDEARLLAAIEPDWLLEHFPDALEESTEAVWDPTREKATRRERLRYGQLVLDEKERAPDASVFALLAERACKAGWRRFCEAAPVEQLLLRLAWARQAGAEDLPEATEEWVEAGLRGLCVGRSSFKELRAADLLGALLGSLSGAQRARLEQLAPARLQLSSGRRLRVRYAPRQAPWVEGYIQDFYGLQELPGAGGERLVAHLQAPNKRAVQVTSDLAGFWERHYPKLMPGLRRRYSKHYWPERPAHAEARLLKARRGSR